MVGGGRAGGRVAVGRDISPALLMALLLFSPLWNSSVSLLYVSKLLKFCVGELALTEIHHQSPEVTDSKKYFKITLQVMCLDNYIFK